MAAAVGGGEDREHPHSPGGTTRERSRSRSPPRFAASTNILKVGERAGAWAGGRAGAAPLHCFPV